MWTLLTILLICWIIKKVRNSNSHNTMTYTRRDYKRDQRMYKKEMKRLRKARERAEMDAWEDMMACIIACSDEWDV